ncbi:hypothetical protein GQ55_3G298800 [Panicum hallii var. hallii]|uniref:Uncharacterized protein n=1 Tax=Panicum hallii var. hallii TaxID=1504633 RepID=A0A2T7EET8_9POAL|nr:hypothetical protein GQ55_3G298800 [Panicum hallii var. hallii]
MATAPGSGRLNPRGKNRSEVLYGGLMLRLGMGRTASDGPVALDEQASEKRESTQVLPLCGPPPPFS